MRILGIVVVAVTLVGTIVAATNEASAENKMYFGAGSISCAEWLRYRSTGDKPNSYQAQAWVDGFLSGYNVAGDDPDFLAPLAPKVGIAVYAWVDNYCGPKPLDQVVEAVLALKNELKQRANRK